MSDLFAAFYRYLVLGLNAIFRIKAYGEKICLLSYAEVLMEVWITSHDMKLY